MIFTIELPRNVIDSKGQGNTDTKYVIKKDKKDIDYKDLANNLDARILGIDFSKDESSRDNRDSYDTFNLPFKNRCFQLINYNDIMVSDA